MAPQRELDHVLAVCAKPFSKKRAVLIRQTYAIESFCSRATDVSDRLRRLAAEEEAQVLRDRAAGKFLHYPRRVTTTASAYSLRSGVGHCFGQARSALSMLPHVSTPELHRLLHNACIYLHRFSASLDDRGKAWILGHMVLGREI